MKIGLIAMSGVRAHNPELTELGLTLPGFVQRNKVIASLPSLGLLTLAGMTPDEYDVDYREIADMRDAQALPLDYDLVAISSFSAQIFEAYEIGDFYMTHNIPVVLGGLHVTCMPQEAAQHCTSVIIGEGELSWPCVLADFKAGEMKRIYRPEFGEEFDLRDAPMPRFDLLDPEKYNRLTVQTSRGCPHRCSFCASSVLLTPAYKLKPVDRVIAGIHAIKEVWDRPFIEFADDNSFVNRHHYKELLRALIPENLRWFTEADISVAHDVELLELMRDAGCQQVLIGLESPRDTSLRGLEVKADWKRKQRDHYVDAIHRIQSHGITVNGCFILGLDGDTPDVFEHVLDFHRETGQYEVQVTLLTAFPGTPLYTQMKQEGRLLHDGAWDRCTLFDLNVEPKDMTCDELQRGFVELVGQLYCEAETNRRRRGFRQLVRQSETARRGVERCVV
jgi:radical SAM superfamily enzyme YgiQ (UPF0313 family)